MVRKFMRACFSHLIDYEAIKAIESKDNFDLHAYRCTRVLPLIIR